MFVDARTLPEGTEIAADICIVGAGAAGITMARELADGRRRIAVFESGGFDFEQETQDLYEGNVVGHSFPPLAIDRLRYLGGATNHWDGSCRPFDPIDFESRSYIPNSGWPFGHEAMAPFYRRAQTICQLGPRGYDPTDWATGDARPLDFGPEAALRTGVYQYSPPTRFGEAYRQDLAAAPGLTVYLNANLVDIEADDAGARVTGLRLACLHGPRFAAKAGLHVLAAGGIENARLLLSADKSQKAGLGNGYDLVGRYFMDHPYVTNAATVLLDRPSALSKFYAGSIVNGHNAQFYLCSPPAVLESEELPNFSIVIQPAEIQDHDYAGASLHAVAHALMSLQWPDRAAFRFGQILRGAESKVERAYAKLLRGAASGSSTNYLCECPPDRDSRVSLIGATDELGMRRVQLDWRLPPDLGKHMRRAHELLARDLGHSGLGRLRLNFNDEDVMSSILTAHHHMGTTRMHHDPKQGVVDENCRVHGLANLFIAGSSVFPTYSFDDPTLTIVALAARLSDHLKTRRE